MYSDKNNNESPIETGDALKEQITGFNGFSNTNIAFDAAREWMNAGKARKFRPSIRDENHERVFENEIRELASRSLQHVLDDAVFIRDRLKMDGKGWHEQIQSLRDRIDAYISGDDQERSRDLGPCWRVTFCNKDGRPETTTYIVRDRSAACQYQKAGHLVQGPEVHPDTLGEDGVWRQHFLDGTSIEVEYRTLQDWREKLNEKFPENDVRDTSSIDDEWELLERSP